MDQAIKGQGNLVDEFSWTPKSRICCLRYPNKNVYLKLIPHGTSILGTRSCQISASNDFTITFGRLMKPGVWIVNRLCTGFHLLQIDWWAIILALSAVTNDIMCTIPLNLPTVIDGLPRWVRKKTEMKYDDSTNYKLNFCSSVIILIIRHLICYCLLKCSLNIS